jgi:hypothetical protein
MRRTHSRGVLALLAITLGVATQLSLAPAAGATVVSAGHGPQVTHPHRVDGTTRGELLGQAWSITYSMPTTEEGNPCQPLGRTGAVVLTGDNSVTCNIEQGTSLIGFFGSTCDNVVDPSVDPSYYAADEKAQRKCAKAADASFIASESLAVDGAAPVTITTPCFEVFSPQEHVYLPADNMYGITPRPATFVAHAWVAIVTHLRLGLNTIVFHAEFTDGGNGTVPFTVNVVPRHHH